MRESMLESPFIRCIRGFGLPGTFVIETSSSELSSDSSMSSSASSIRLSPPFPLSEEEEEEDDEEEDDEDVDEEVVPSEEVLSSSLSSSALELSFSEESSRELTVEVVSVDELESELRLCLRARPLGAGALERFEGETVEEGSSSSSGRFLLVSSI